MFWPWILAHKLTLYSIFAFYPAILMGRYNDKFGVSFLLVIASAALVGVGGYLLQCLLPEYALHDVFRAAIYQLYIGVLLLGVLGRIGKFGDN